MSRRGLLSLALCLLGLAGVAALVAAAGGPGVLLAAAARIEGRRIPLLFLPYAVVYVLDALGWYFSFGAEKPKVGPLRFFALRMAGESLNNVTPLGYMGGEPMKAILLARAGCPLPQGFASIVIARTLMTVAHVAFVLAGCAAAAATLRRDQGLSMSLGIVLAGFALGLAAFLQLQRRGLLGRLLALADLAGLGGRIAPGRRERIHEVDRLLQSFYRDRRRDFAAATVAFILGWLAGVPEVLWMLQAMGQPVDLRTALAIESLATVAKAAGFLVPGSIGAQEAGIVAMLSIFGYPPSVALPFSLLRRCREILWVSIGLSCLGWQLRKGRAGQQGP